MVSRGLPHFASGEVIKGFGRGSKELGCPTANLPTETVKSLPDEVGTGVYFGWASVDGGPVLKMVMCIGWNPFYKNSQKSMEVHIMKKFDEDFYGSILKIGILGYIRAEMDFKSLQDLIDTINNDIKIAGEELDKPEHAKYRDHEFFKVSIANGSCNNKAK